MSDIAKVFVFSISSYVFLFIIAKLLGKKQIAQLSFIDYIVGISIGSIAAELATETSEPFYHYLIAMGVFFIFDLCVSLFGRKGAFMKKLMTGKPLVIIENGKIDYKKLKESKITIDELLGMARGKGYFDIEEIEFAIFETSGNLSILPKSEYSPLTATDMKINLPKAALTEYLVVDGEISKDRLNSSGHDKEWLFKGLNIEDEKALKNILLAAYDTKQHNFIVHYKNELGEND